MHDHPDFRLVFFVDMERRILIARPVGHATGAEFVAKLFEAYATVDAPWTFRRLHDHRRFEGTFDAVDQEEYLVRWAILAEGQTYHTDVAVVELMANDTMRHATPSPVSANEQICYFTDYHEAMGWLLASDKSAYLDRARMSPLRGFDSGSIEIH